MSEEQIKNLEDQFNARIERDEKIEPKDWMPEKYQKDAYSSNVSTCPFGDCWNVT